jgi:F-type H+-transporting ATPase subunit c
MRIRKIALLAFVLLAALAMPASAQQVPAETAAPPLDLGILGAAFAIGLAAAIGTLGQAKATAAACSAMARNPGAAANIRFALILGLALMESLVIYALVIAMRGAGIF